ncbi:hypothetical protein [Alteromonas hispanica]|uniref:Uncharacterized protein n=1 Tax=Alteromonas hispanica TaxID=315421 RepID=A0A6L9MS89_9ALTE|nr:hypothetical protein [Alteromonas hispanica]NDW20987.1 hypothetical protein [Alteromonas hispanica]
MFIRVASALTLSILVVFSVQGIAQTTSTENAESVSSADKDTTVVATLFGKPIIMDDITPSEDVLATMQKQAGSRGEFNGMLALASLTELSEQIIEGVLDDYAATHTITVDQALVEKFKEKFASSTVKPEQAADDSDSANSSSSNPGSASGGKTSSDEIAQRQVMIYLTEKHMYNALGGKVVFRQSNPQMPVEAYFNVLKEYEQSGKFEIVDKSLQEGFWSPFTPPYQYELAKENIDFSKPWWL